MRIELCLKKLNLKGVPKSFKEMERASKFHDFLSEKLHYEKKNKK